MKSYDDIAERVFKKGDEILKRRQKRAALIRKTSLVVSEICAGVLICFGIWKAGDIQLSMNHNFPDTVISESESTTASPAPVSTASNNDDVIYASETVAVSKPNMEQTTFSAGSAPGNTALNTSASDNISAAQSQTALNTTQIPKPIQTTVCTTVQTENEGSIYMKKLTAFGMSAITIAASITPMIGNAEYKIDESRFHEGEKAIFAKMESGELDVDINGNGEFDVFDGFMLECYTFYQPKFIYHRPQNYYTFDKETSARIDAIADYNGDGEVTSEDLRHLKRYFIVSRNLKNEHLYFTYYDPEFIVDEKERFPYDDVLYTYVMDLRKEMKYLLAGYDIVEELYEDGTIDLDFNGNGQLDVGDVYTLNVFYNLYKDQNAAFYDIKYIENSYISEEEWNRCEEARSHYPHTNEFYPVFTNYHYRSDSIHYLLFHSSRYIAAHTELKSEYFTEEYYAEKYGENHYCPEHWITSAIVQQAAEDMGIVANSNAWIKYNLDDLNDIFAVYCRNVEGGLRPAPDVNMDGVVDLNDYFVMNTYLTELIADKTADNSILSAEIWNNINENFDINENGTTKDIYDILTVQMYVIKYTDTSDYDAAYDRYKESLGVNSIPESESLSYEKKADILADIESQTICGDANCDGEVTIADAAAILQYLGNNEKFPLREIGKSNASSSDGIAGITAKDAIAIQLFKSKVISELPESFTVSQNISFND